MERKSEEGAERLEALKSDLTEGKIDADEYADSANTILVFIIQHAAQTTLGQIDSRDWLARDDGPSIQPDSEEASKITKYRDSSNDPEIKNAQSRLQAARNDLQMAKESSASPNTIQGHVDEVRDANHMKRTKHPQRQQFATTEVTGQVQQIPSDKQSMWDLLRAYKTDHIKSTLPEQTNDNSSKDGRIWTLGPRTFDPLVWHRFRYALGHHMFRHKESPFNEKQAFSIQSFATRIAHEIDHPLNPLFESPIHKKEVMDEMQRLITDKSPGPDGVTNRMLRSGGEKFNTLLHEVIATLWKHQVQPSEWQKSSMQPIYKSSKKPKPDPASYRGIYLSCALAKLFEGILSSDPHSIPSNTAHFQTTNLAQGQTAKSTTLSIPSLP